MTEESFLIAHKVRGKLAFDVAGKMQCPICHGDDATHPGYCYNCEDTGYWWILATIGHRAYPFWHISLDELFSAPDKGSLAIRELIGTDEPPADLRDFYAIHDRQVKVKPSVKISQSAEDLLKELGL